MTRTSAIAAALAAAAAATLVAAPQFAQAQQFRQLTIARFVTPTQVQYHTYNVPTPLPGQSYGLSIPSRSQYQTYALPSPNTAGYGPAGAQFGRMPVYNSSFVDPTRNSVNAHQTQNSVQATNTQMSGQAVQGRNCYLNAIKAGLCQGR